MMSLKGRELLIEKNELRGSEGNNGACRFFFNVGLKGCLFSVILSVQPPICVGGIINMSCQENRL